MHSLPESISLIYTQKTKVLVRAVGSGSALSGGRGPGPYAWTPHHVASSCSSERLQVRREHGSVEFRADMQRHVCEPRETLRSGKTGDKACSHNGPRTGVGLRTDTPGGPTEESAGREPLGTSKDYCLHGPVMPPWPWFPWPGRPRPPRLGAAHT